MVRIHSNFQHTNQFSFKNKLIYTTKFNRIQEENALGYLSEVEQGNGRFSPQKRNLNKTAKSFPYRSFKLTMQFRISFHRQSLTIVTPILENHFSSPPIQFHPHGCPITLSYVIISNHLAPFNLMGPHQEVHLSRSVCHGRKLRRSAGD